LKKPGKIVVWLANLHATKTRRDGRKLPKALCVDSPRLSELEAAAKALGLKPEIVQDAARPNRWWEKTGYITVERKGKTKVKVLKEVAAELAKFRKAKQ